MSRTKINVRALEPDDLDQVVRIDERLTGQTRKDYWKKRFELSSLRPQWMSLVAETDQRLVGFLFGWTSESEFGIQGSVAWIDLIGVDPPYRGRGVGQALVERFVSAAQELRAVKQVNTLIDLAQSDVREFFMKLGFKHGPMIQLERQVTG